MSIAIPQRFLMARGITSVLNYLHIDLAAAVVALLLLTATGLAKTSDLFSVLEPTFAGTDAIAESRSPNQQIADPARQLSLTMAGALDFVAQRYRVAPEGLLPVFEAAQTAARERNLDPLLIVAVIGIESGFNPFAQSNMGAQGLMQIIPRYHQDKLPAVSAASTFLDPVTNVTIGARILQESIRRQGGLMEGLQYYAGASDDPEQGYANKVLAEKQRLEHILRRKDSQN
ncbi:MAG: transglycosylase SLT domain-containing protein [Sulfuritalea sp.]|nr:transglycosylase SLT domain-containing protein [Sulfuritalea sp.]